MIELPTFEHITKTGEVKFFDWNIFQVDPIKNLINITPIGLVFGKKVNDWLNLKQTKELIDSYQGRGIDKNQIVNVIHGGNKSGTWAYKELAIQFAMWISPKFGFWVVQQFCILFKDDQKIVEKFFEYAKEEQKEPKNVYALYNKYTNRIKIGISKEIEVRKQDLECGAGCDLELIYLSEEIQFPHIVENKIHKRLDRYKVFSEWFDCDKNTVINCIKNECEKKYD